MKDITELFWNASLEEIKLGYVYNAQTQDYTCLICGSKFTKGIIYLYDNVYYEAEKYLRLHISKEHISVFDYLLNLDKKLTGLTEHQKTLLALFSKGFNDKAIVNELGGGSTSTIRNHRFSLREKEKQSKIFLAIMGLLEGQEKTEQKFIDIHRTATMIDNRYAITHKENEEFLDKYFEEGLDGPLSKFPIKQKRKIIVLRHIITKFDGTKKYTEKEVNEILKNIYSDYVTLRRYLIEYGFMDRMDDGSLYWVKN